MAGSSPAKTKLFGGFLSCFWTRNFPRTALRGVGEGLGVDCIVAPLPHCERLLERAVVADKAAKAGNPVVERPRRSVVLLRRPVEPVAAALAGGRGNRFDQAAADAAAPCLGVDEEILRVADLLGSPRMRVEEIVRDPDERRGRAALPRTQTVDRAVRGDQP